MDVIQALKTSLATALINLFVGALALISIWGLLFVFVPNVGFKIFISAFAAVVFAFILLLPYIYYKCYQEVYKDDFEERLINNEFYETDERKALTKEMQAWRKK